MTPDPEDPTGSAVVRRTALLASAAVLAQAVLTLGWIIGSAVQGPRYSVARHDISDTAAITANHPWVLLVAEGLAGISTILFAIGALRPSLRASGRLTPMGAWLVVGSWVGLANLSDALFRLDCRHADRGCTLAAASTSWHARIHVVVGTVTLVVTLATPFVLAREMRLVEGWRSLAIPSVVYGAVVLMVTISYAALHDREGGGYAQRTVILLTSAGVVVLALRVRRLARGP